MPECAKSHLQQSIISKFSGGGPPDPPLQGEGREGAGQGGRKGREGRRGVEGRPRLKRGRGEGRGGKGNGREGKVGGRGCRGPTRYFVQGPPSS